MGFNDEKAVDIIAGMSVGGWYADEIARCPQSAVEMAISRCSDKNSKMFWNTNPESPYHYIFTNYINNKSLIDAGTVKVWKFLLDDNPNLDPNYVAELKKFPKNVKGQYSPYYGSL